jgi:hypothetical protein
MMLHATNPGYSLSILSIFMDSTETEGQKTGARFRLPLRHAVGERARGEVVLGEQGAKLRSCCVGKSLSGLNDRSTGMTLSFCRTPS